jgi:predicted DNA-binding transcriptional regulator AlpA
MADKRETEKQRKLIGKSTVLERVPVTYPTIWSLMKKGLFPRSRILGGKICWLESEIDQWMEELPKRRFKGEAS